MPSPDHPTSPSPPLRKEGLAKVLGRAQYIDDLDPPGLWHGATVRASIARGRIRAIHFDPSVNWSEFTIVRAADIPGENTVVHLGKDHPCLADPHINHAEEPILLLAHPDTAALLRARASIHIEYDELPGIFTIEDSEAAATQFLQTGDSSGILWNSPEGDSPNTFKTYLMRKDGKPIPDSTWANADFVVEETYTTGAQEQLYIEPNGVIAEAHRAPDGTLVSVTVQGSMQCPFYVVHALALVFDLPQENCRVIQTETGGAFGGKEDFPSVIGSHAALLAWKSGHPVKLVYDRAEDMAATTKRHPSRTRIRVAVSKEGKLLAGEIDFTIDGGAYATLSPVVLSRGTIHAPGPYHWPLLDRSLAKRHGHQRPAPRRLPRLRRAAIHLRPRAPPRPRRRRPQPLPRRSTPPQLPHHRRPHRHRPDPLRPRRHAGAAHPRPPRSPTTTGSATDFDRDNPTSPIKRGIGFATFFHGAGFTGSGERRLNSLVTHRDRTRHRPPAKSSSPPPSSARAPTPSSARSPPTPSTSRYDDVLIAQPDTAVVPNSGPTVASRTAMIVGRLVQQAAEQLCGTLVAAGLPQPYTPAQFLAAARAFCAQHGALEANARYQAPGDIFWDDDTYSGEAYPAYAWAVYVAEVAVDTRTYTATVTNFHALQEVGRVLHPHPRLPARSKAASLRASATPSTKTASTPPASCATIR